MNILFSVSHVTIQRTIRKLSNQLSKIRNRHWFICDITVFAMTPLLALGLRLDGNLNLQEDIFQLGIATILFLVVKLIIFWGFGFYRRYWKYASIEEGIYIITLMMGVVVIQTTLFNLLEMLLGELPQSLPILEGILSCIFVILLRFSVRVVERISHRQKISKNRERVLIIGAGSAGVSLVEDMQRNPQFGAYPVGFIDDDIKKQNIHLRGIPVLGNRQKISEVIKTLKIHKVIIAMPTVPGQTIREIVDICQNNGVQPSTLPGIYEILNGRVRVDSVRDIKIEDLLRREPIQTELERVAQFIKNKTVLITGSGGSIGSELCRQILRCHPAKIILIGHGENSVFNIQQELEKLIQILKNNHKSAPDVNIPQIYTFIADIRVQSRLEHAFERFKPDVIFHAAAHKHVPLMELNPAEAITNNVMGTRNLLQVALQYNVEHFVMISTDKAVNPTNVMGASKRVAEMLVLQAAKESGKSYVAVRFGNVLGSRGSVVPTFQKQILAGGPITVTHPDICRYFMTIPEAVQLVLQASILGRSGEVLMLNMGEPVKIVDLAKALIHLSGYEVNKDIDIVFTGLRPGEKLFEELFIEGEEYENTEHEKLLVVKNASRIIPNSLNITVEKLLGVAARNDTNSIILLLSQLVAGYKPKFPEESSLLDAAKYANQTSHRPVNILANIEPTGA
ncbi:polysaccharide biosynthesis protein [Dolichospermum circinale]|jgi:FlaA1/EpsC-like NDP-sugar epimerase|uniref:polysaccharide biosynthesis protein n=1 Tax=Dolichospermum circinale TaxID=109265 RepID=UPI000420B665|nr:nucleoside-diphosphate sugar epimerase/dehydratase [Dolichospermum circinale]MDB9455556.1 nucleoside-diphosphate sugar epimerase/dehydratase [Dolichospermum circinale CS-541/06]MDB9461681.1 nucleoside-diphosphate sugar epimerase/dehydratase [Dolichospermum circinale CS-541/04]MDB9475828.1 nucleoside-diphosphate sugar epimerase/dehydratase [Dolichospermum circinale CS-537/11]MDB9477793.1 nucleoside-diphosphate sugar epimerase/dehydratase [Dolichospermum circinale CS-537/03]MDB9547839.1 nucle